MFGVHKGHYIPLMNARRQEIVRSSDAFFAENPVFSLDQFAARLQLTPRQAQERAKHHLKRGRLRALEKGLYAVVPVTRRASRFRVDRFLVAAAARPDAIFSHHSALELLGVAHSEWNVTTVFTARRRRKLALGRVEIRFLSHPTALVRRRLENVATRRVERQGRLVRVTSPERTLVEGFRHPSLVGGLSELVDSAAGLGVLDLELLDEVLRAYAQRSLWASVGWFLERFRETFFVPPKYLARLEARKPRSPQYLPRGLESGSFVSRWNLVLPTNVVGEREPDELE